MNYFSAVIFVKSNRVNCWLKMVLDLRDKYNQARASKNKQFGQ